MESKKVPCLLAVLLTVALPSSLSAENGAYTGSGGTFSTGTSAGTAISVQSVPIAGTTATLSFTCPISSFGAGTYQWNWQCAGGSIGIASSDNSIIMSGAFTSATMTFSGSGGGRGGHVSYSYQFNGTFTSRVLLSGAGQGALGSISLAVHTTAPLGAGTASVTGFNLGWNSAYSPIVVATASSLLRADNLTGIFVTSYGTWGSGTGQFEQIDGLAHDSGGRIYITDSSLDRLVRIDNIKGRNWTQLGSSGTGPLHFSGPAGVAVDSSGKIWVADAGNNCIVRFDDMTGTNWTTFGSAGAGTNQFSSPTAIAFDAAGRIYVTDSGNARLVRFDDLTGKNWTTLSTLNIGVYGYNFSGARGVAILPTGKIFVSTYSYTYLVGDMTGANAEAGYWGAAGLAGISADPGGAIYVAGGFTPGLALTLDAVGSGYFSGNMGQSSIQPTAVLSLAKSVVPPAAPVLSTGWIGFGKRNVGEPSPAMPLTLNNIGGASMPINSVTADADFLITNPCPPSLDGGTSCTLDVQFDPTSVGVTSSHITVSTSSVRPQLNVGLGGTGTKPIGALLPTSLTFNPQQTTTTSSAQAAILTNTGTGPLTIPSITASGDFSVTSNCPAVMLAGNGCTLQVNFAPTAAGARVGSINIVDDNVPGGVTQTINLAGTGSAAAPALTLAPEGLLFPTQQVGVPSATQTLTLTNASTAAVSLSAPVLPAGFTGSTTCGASLAKGASCKVLVEFVPTTAGPVSGTVTIPVTGQAALSADVAGTGISSGSPVLMATPSPVAFGPYVVGDNPSMNMTVTNPKGYPVGIRSVGLSGSAAFTVTGNNCPATLAGGASCTVQFTFIPTQVTSYAATWTLTETSGAKSIIAITGSGATDSGGN